MSQQAPDQANLKPNDGYDTTHILVTILGGSPSWDNPPDRWVEDAFFVPARPTTGEGWCILDVFDDMLYPHMHAENTSPASRVIAWMKEDWPEPYQGD